MSNTLASIAASGVTRDGFRPEFPWLVCTWANDPHGSGYLCLRCGVHFPHVHAATSFSFAALIVEDTFVRNHAACPLPVPTFERMAPMPRMPFAEALEAAPVYLRERDLEVGEKFRLRMVDGQVGGVRLLATQIDDQDPEFRRFTDPEQSEPDAEPAPPPADLLTGAYWTPL